MITETAEVEAALAPLRARGIPVNFQRLVIKGAEATAEETRIAAGDEGRRHKTREEFLRWTLEGAPGLDIDLTRPAWKRPSVEKLFEEES